MSEYRQSPDFESNPASLATVWENTAKSLVLHAEHVESLPPEQATSDTAPQPYVFRHVIEPRETSIALGDYGTVLQSTIEYHSAHVNPVDSQETQEFVAIDWTTHESGDFVAVNRRMVIRRYTNPSRQSIEGYRLERDVEYDVDMIAKQKLVLPDEDGAWLKQPLSESDFDAFTRFSQQLNNQPPLYS